MLSASYAERIGAFIAGSVAHELPRAVVEKAKRHVLDTFGAALAGTTSDEARATRAMLSAAEGGGPAAAWGTRLTLSARSAALANGVAAHAFELDDTGGCDHSGAVVLPASVAALALASPPTTGMEFLLAVVLGYDIGRRVLEAFGGYQAHNGAGWHSTGTCGVFGAAAAACRILRLDPSQCVAAVGLAASFAGGLWAFIHDGSQAKRIHAGRAAEGGLLAALLAARGITGPRRVFDDVWGGLLPSFAHGPTDAEALVRGLGASWKIALCAIKPHASCRGTHSAVDAVGRITQRHTLSAAELARIEVRLSAFLHGMCGSRDVTTLPAAQMSLPYAVAARIVVGHAGLAAYAPTWRQDRALTEVMDRVEMLVDPGMAPDEEPFVALCTRDGRRFEEQVAVPLGAPENPLHDDTLAAKFMNLAALVMPTQDAVRLREAVLQLDVLDDVRDLLPLLVPAVGCP